MNAIIAATVSVAEAHMKSLALPVAIALSALGADRCEAQPIEGLGLWAKNYCRIAIEHENDDVRCLPARGHKERDYHLLVKGQGDDFVLRNAMGAELTRLTMTHNSPDLTILSDGNNVLTIDNRTNGFIRTFIHEGIAVYITGWFRETLAP